MQQNESAAQIELFKLIRLRAKTSAKWNSIFAIPNGGLRNKTVAAKMQAEGAKAGVWDIFVPIQTETRAGLFIEMKHGKNKTTAAQTEFLHTLSEANIGFKSYEWRICYNHKEAYDAICDYFQEESKNKKGVNKIYSIYTK